MVFVSVRTFWVETSSVIEHLPPFLFLSFLLLPFRVVFIIDKFVVFTVAECNQPNGGLIFLFILVLWIYVTIMQFLSQSSKADTRQLLYFLQISFLFVSVEIKWLAFFSVFEFNIFQSSGSTCVYPMKGVERLLPGIVVPCFCFAMFFVNWAVARLLVYCPSCPVHRMRTFSMIKPGGSLHQSPFVRTLLALCTFTCTCCVDETFCHHILT